MSRKKTSLSRDDLIFKLQRYWVVEVFLPKKTRPKTQLFVSLTSIRDVNNVSFVCRYWALGLIPRVVKVKWVDILGIKPIIVRRKRVATNDFLKIVSNSDKQLRRRMVWRTQIFKWSVILGFLIVIATISFLIAYFLK